jgi:N-acetylglucosamine kinase-like BadF-type ATPase
MFFLGVDGGGTKTTAVLSDLQGEVIRTIRLGPGNIAVLDRGSVAQLIRNIIFELLRSDSVDQIEAATFAFAGAGRLEEKKTADELIRALGLRNFSVMTDAEILYYSIFGEDPGILISAGTGSICLVKTADQKSHQIGGWGYLLGDEGSGFDIGRKAIKMALEEVTVKDSFSSFTSKLLSFYGLQHPENLISIVYSSVNPPKLIASCARLICQLAESGEPLALGIVDQASSALVNYAEQAIFHFGPDRKKTYQIALAGGILEETSIVHYQFRQKLAEKRFIVSYKKQELEPAAAGVLYAINQSQPIASSRIRDKLKMIRF